MNEETFLFPGQHANTSPLVGAAALIYKAAEQAGKAQRGSDRFIDI